MFPARDVAAAAARACRRDSGGGSALLSARLSLPAAAAAGCLRRHPELVSAGGVRSQECELCDLGEGCDRRHVGGAGRCPP